MSMSRLGSGPAFPEPSASVPSNPTELVPFAVVLALACLGTMLSRREGIAAGAGVARAVVILAAAAGLAGIALAEPDGRFAFLLVPALAIAAAGLVAAHLYLRAAVVAVAVLVASAPSVFWYLSSSLRVEEHGGGLTSATRDVVPGLIAVGVMVAAAGITGAFARRAARTARDPLSR
jgi:4-amino-4-deoxy-L-arabinose transferase-like glycosyltransferase